MLYREIGVIKWLALVTAILFFIALPASGQDSTQVASPDSLPKSLPATYEFHTTGSPIKNIDLYESRSMRLTSEQKKRRVWLVGGAHVALWGISFIALDQAWYKDYPKSSFHFFNDNREWQQMDKAGHVWTAYQMSRISGALWNWAGLKPHQSAWLGGLSGVAYQSIIEIQDGFSDEWGFSWGDMAANITGSALYTAQQLLWQEQRLQVKLSYWPYDYNTPELTARRNQLFGNSVQERILKDYNSQTYWVSANLRSFLPNTKLPKWLNLSVGYSAEGMLGGHENRWTDKGGEDHYRPDIARTRHFYLSPDIDLTKIKTSSRFLRSALSLLNMIKIPAPTLELTSKGKVKGHWVYF